MNPYKTTLLKLLDSYLQSLSIESLVVRSEVVELHWNLTPILASIFLTLSNYGRQSLYRSVGSSNFTAGSPTTQLHTSPRSSKSGGLPANSSTASPLPVEANLTSPTIGQSPEVSIPFELDVLLPKVCEAIVIVTQCITTISLQSEDHRESYLHSIPGKSHLDRYIPKDYYNLTTLDGEGFAEHIIGTSWFTMKSIVITAPHQTFSDYWIYFCHESILGDLYLLNRHIPPCLQLSSPRFRHQMRTVSPILNAT